ncbi:DNA-processing protein DprA [Lentilactobacillus otakiensis]|uniref:DNA protecting protein DprA n=1 Tax=Lentilactobacillus otakiensis DSM 19908 = JCM 15040 TaxID=1423780 RepID=S4PND5_9LACO|nr:DNA-processing protein DprA [Lentilactobacillus otakiensis]MBZ3775786.1 DNA-processing protein DprA [Lentilactobacillus otakiensis]MDV3519005.1 DNA-processing protein DprA [Lentilactobacillus otakiensis]GAD15830.1 DNA protecting protein DprA [Lentilactobacillus otakiensis DSM 19908 = JCM 15040]
MLLRDFLLRIHLCKGIGIIGKSKIYTWMDRVGWNDLQIPTAGFLSAVAQLNSRNSAVFRQSYEQLIQDDEQVIKLVDGERWLTIVDAEYPLQLRESYAPPLVLFYRGDLDLLKHPLLGIVGARDCTSYSVEILKNLIPGRVSNTMTIVSGLAKGVDTLAHQCAIANNGCTIGVIGTGMDICYPYSNQDLQASIARDHLLISEYPNHTKGYRNHFPERNRIIAGLVQSVLVTEAKQHSGSLITANLALQNNRNVLAVPGSILAPLSVGTNELIVAGAKPVLRDLDILEEYFHTGI